VKDVVERLPATAQTHWRRAAEHWMPKKNGAVAELAKWLRDDYPDAAGRSPQGMEQCFTIKRRKVPPSLHLCLATMNLIESSQSQECGCGCAGVTQACGLARPMSTGSLCGNRKDFPSHDGLQPFWGPKTRGAQPSMVEQSVA
jgi:hypothetical protein